MNATPKATTPRISLSLRIDPTTMGRLRRLLEHLARHHPTFRLSVSDAARVAIDEGLTALEKSAKRGPGPR